MALAGERIRSPALKPIWSSLLVLLAVAILLPLSGCGGEPEADPQQVLDTALNRESLLALPVAPAEVEVASLGFNDAVLDSRRLAISAGTNRTIREALAGSAGEGVGAGEGTDEGAGGDAEQGLAGLIDGLATGEAAELDGEQVDSVTGSIDVDGLIESVRPLAEEPGDEGSAEIPGVGELDRLQQTLVAAEFELFAAGDDGSLERFDLILSFDVPDNALPPSRIRFSLTDAPPGAGTP